MKILICIGIAALFATTSHAKTSSDKKNLPKDDEAVRRAVLDNCDAGDKDPEEFPQFDSCFDAAKYFESDQAKHLEYLRKSCSREYGRACYELEKIENQNGNKEAALDFRRRGMTYTKQMNRKIAEQKCKNGSAEACREAGEIATLQRDDSGAKNNFRKSCDRGSLEACSELGKILIGKGEIVEATSLQKKACDGKYYAACAELGSIEEKKGNTDRATKLYETSCNKVRAGCLELAVLYSKIGRSKDARKILNKECDSGYQSACEMLPSIQ